MDTLRRAYEAMIFGEAPAWSNIARDLAALVERLNHLVAGKSRT